MVHGPRPSEPATSSVTGSSWAYRLDQFMTIARDVSVRSGVTRRMK